MGGSNGNDAPGLTICMPGGDGEPNRWQPGRQTYSEDDVLQMGDLGWQAALDSLADVEWNNAVYIRNVLEAGLEAVFHVHFLDSARRAAISDRFRIGEISDARLPGFLSAYDFGLLGTKDQGFHPKPRARLNAMSDIGYIYIPTHAFRCNDDRSAAGKGYMVRLFDRKFCQSIYHRGDHSGDKPDEDRTLGYRLGSDEDIRRFSDKDWLPADFHDPGLLGDCIEIAADVWGKALYDFSMAMPCDFSKFPSEKLYALVDRLAEYYDRKVISPAKRPGDDTFSEMH